jgi:hypothetical protein
MMPAHVALFPYEAELRKDPDFLDELMLVTSALQTQVTRDVGPIWGISAVVSAFSSLEVVPEGYVPFGITQQALPLNRTGFHFTADGQPMALIEHCGDWATAASHELIEMLIDPTGTKVVAAPSLGDRKLDAIKNPAEVVENESSYERQQLVVYLVEVCDPCEQSTYTIGTVNVSDFVTPDYYEADPGPDYIRYSFTGRIPAPFGLLEGGYITWRTEASVYQAFGPGSGDRLVSPRNLEIRRVAAAPQLLSRSWIDAHADAKTDARSTPCGGVKYYVARTSAAEEYAAGLRNQIRNALQASGSPHSLDQLLTLVRLLGRDPKFRKSFERDPHAAITSLGYRVPSGFPPAGSPLDTPLPPPEDYQRLQYLLEQGHRVGYSFTEPAALVWGGKFPGI